MGPGSRFACPGRRGCEFAFSRRDTPEVLHFVSPPEMRGRREDRVLAAPAVSCASCVSKCAHEHTGSAETLRPSLRNGFTAYIVLSPVSRGSVATVARGSVSFSRAWRQHSGVRTTRLYRTHQCRSLSALPRPQHPTARSWRSWSAPLVGWDAQIEALISPSDKAKYIWFRAWHDFRKSEVICPGFRRRSLSYGGQVVATILAMTANCVTGGTALRSRGFPPAVTVVPRVFP